MPLHATRNPPRYYVETDHSHDRPYAVVDSRTGDVIDRRYATRQKAVDLAAAENEAASRPRRSEPFAYAYMPNGRAQRAGRKSARNPLYPSSTRGTKPLDARTHESVWSAGYEAASQAATHAAKRGGPRRVDGDDLFVLAAGKDRRIPAGINESHPQFWEYVGTFIEGAKAYASEHAADRDRKIVVR